MVDRNGADSHVPGRNGNSITVPRTRSIALYWQNRCHKRIRASVFYPPPKIRGVTINGVTDEQRDASPWRQVVLEFPSRGTDKSCRGKTSSARPGPASNLPDNLGTWIDRSSSR